MKFLSFIATGVMALSLALVSLDADAAKRMGGGKSMGKQSNNVTQQQAAPASTGAGAATGAAATGTGFWSMLFPEAPTTSSRVKAKMLEVKRTMSASEIMRGIMFPP